MPSSPKPLPRRGYVRVTHPRFGEKDVLRSRLASLGPAWKRVEPRKSTARTAQPKASAPADAVDTGIATPDASKED